MCCPPATCVSLAANKATAGNIGKRCRLTVAQGYINVLTPAALTSAKQCSHDTVAGVEAGGQVCYGHTDFDGRSISGAGNMHEAKFSLNHDVVASTTGGRASLAITGNGGVYETGVNLA